MVDDPNDEDFVPFRPRRSPRMSLRSSVAQRAGRSSVGTKMTCAHCRTPLQKGQTAYQRKGLPQLFCSSSCLTTFSKKPSGKKTCTFCKKYVLVWPGLPGPQGRGTVRHGAEETSRVGLGGRQFGKEV